MSDIQPGDKIVCVKDSHHCEFCHADFFNPCSCDNRCAPNNPIRGRYYTANKVGAGVCGNCGHRVLCLDTAETADGYHCWPAVCFRKVESDHIDIFSLAEKSTLKVPVDA